MRVVDSIVQWRCLGNVFSRDPWWVANNEIDCEGEFEIFAQLAIESHFFGLLYFASLLLRFHVFEVKVDDVCLPGADSGAHAEYLAIHLSGFYGIWLGVEGEDIAFVSSTLAHHDRQNTCAASQVHHVAEVSRVVTLALLNVVRKQIKVFLRSRSVDTVLGVNKPRIKTVDHDAFLCHRFGRGHSFNDWDWHKVVWLVE